MVRSRVFSEKERGAPCPILTKNGFRESCLPTGIQQEKKILQNNNTGEENDILRRRRKNNSGGSQKGHVHRNPSTKAGTDPICSV